MVPGETGESAEISAFASSPLIAGMAEQVKGWMELERLLPQLPEPGSLPPAAGVLVFPSEISMLTAGSGILGAEHDVNVDINLKDPGELVKSTFSRVELTTDVAGDLNLGMNMDFNEGD